MDIRVVDNSEEHRFELWRDDVRAGFVTYRLHDPVITFIHTEVDPAFSGEGLGARLATGALDSARERGLKVKPLCPFIASYIKRNPEYADLVA
jgi:predicted GNAT family acetyltransferase